MELKQFIKTALIDICEAVHEAQDAVADKVAIAPAIVDEQPVDPEQLINFEILVTVSDAVAGEGSGKIQVLPLVSVGVDASINTQKQNINKIQFNVPVYFSKQFNHRKVNKHCACCEEKGLA